MTIDWLPGWLALPFQGCPGVFESALPDGATGAMELPVQLAVLLLLVVAALFAFAAGLYSWFEGKRRPFLVNALLSIGLSILFLIIQTKRYSGIPEPWPGNMYTASYFQAAGEFGIAHLGATAFLLISVPVGYLRFGGVIHRLAGMLIMIAWPILAIGWLAMTYSWYRCV